MESVKITHLNGIYFRLLDKYGEIEISKDLNYLRDMFDDFKNDEYIQELYYGEDDGLVIVQEVYNNGRLIKSEEVYKWKDT